jgi:hypothetical protein
MGSGAPDTFRGFTLMTGATRGIVRRGPPLRPPSGDSGEVPLGRGSPVIPRWCCKLDTRETLEPCWLSYGDDGLVMLSCVMPAFIRLSTLLRLESANWELTSTLSLWSKPWLSDGRALDWLRVSVCFDQVERVKPYMLRNPRWVPTR